MAIESGQTPWRPRTPPIKTATVLAIAIVVLLAAVIACLFGLTIQTPVHDIINVVVGVVIAKFGTVYDYYFGSSKDQPPPPVSSQ